MKIHEYQAAELFSDYGIDSAPSRIVDNTEDALKAAEEIGGKVVLKAQVLVGGRGKAGGIKLAKDPSEVKQYSKQILSMEIKSIPVKKLLVASAVDIEKEYYLGITIDRTNKKLVLVLSAAGGVEIEELAKESPDQIHKMYIAPSTGIDDTRLNDLTLKVFGSQDLADKANDTIKKIYKLFIEKDCSLVEINPYVMTAGGDLLAIDAKINFDDNGTFKHPEIEKLRNPEEYSKDEILAKESGLSFVSMEGDIGCIVNGAGLAMATMDIIKLFGGEAANFLDVGGSSNPEKVLNALKIILSNSKVKAVLINIFGGITRCDDIANGIIMAAGQIEIKVPLIIRLIGTNEEEGREILRKNGYTAVEEMTDAVKQAVKAAK